MTESPCAGCKHLKLAWRKGNLAYKYWLCSRYKCKPECKCVDFVERK